MPIPATCTAIWKSITWLSTRQLDLNITIREKERPHRVQQGNVPLRSLLSLPLSFAVVLVSTKSLQFHIISACLILETTCQYLVISWHYLCQYIVTVLLISPSTTTHFLNRTTPEIQRPHEYLYLVLMQWPTCIMMLLCKSAIFVKRSNGSTVGHVECSVCFGSLAG